MNPKRTKQQKLGNVGSASFELFVNRELGWIFRPVHQENDFGIDGYIDIVEGGEVTGASLAVQIKCGKSYVSKRTSGGIRYEGSIKHLNYYSNLRHPVLLIILDEKGENGWWVLFQLDKTQPCRASDKWWVEIPDRNTLSPSVRNEWQGFAGPTFNFEDTIQEEWDRDLLHSFSTNLIVGIEKEHVLACDPLSLFLWQDKLTKTRQMMLKKRAKVEFWFQGWRDDERELYEIEEVRNYLTVTVKNGFPWIYWLEPDVLWVGYQLLFACTCPVGLKVQDNKHMLVIDGPALSTWVQEQFYNLNVFTEKHDIPIEINQALSENLHRFMKTKLHGIQSNDG